jgi:hypothetical protein
MQSSASSTRQSASERVSELFTRDSTLPLDPSGDLESHDTSEAFFCSLAGCHSSEPSRDFSQSSSADIGCPSIEHLDEDFQGAATSLPNRRINETAACSSLHC